MSHINIHLPEPVEGRSITVEATGVLVKVYGTAGGDIELKPRKLLILKATKKGWKRQRFAEFRKKLLG